MDLTDFVIFDFLWFYPFAIIGGYWWILQMCMALAALFAIIMTAGMAYKMMVKHEPLDVMKLFRPLAVSLVLCWWYPPADTGMAGSGSNWCFLDFLSYIPNCIGSYTPRPLPGGSRADQRQVRGSAGTHLRARHDVHQPPGAGGRGPYRHIRPEPDRGHDGTDRRGRSDQYGERRGQAVVHLADLRHRRGHRQNHHAHRPCGVPYRVVGDDILPADPAGDADDIRANTVGFLAAAQMGRRVGEVAHEVSDGTLLRGDALLRGLLRIAPVRHRAVHPGGEPDGDNGKRADDGRLPAELVLLRRYLMAASIVALKCLNLVPDLAAWMIPEGDTAFSTRNFGEGVAQQAKMTATGAIGTMTR